MQINTKNGLMAVSLINLGKYWVFWLRQNRPLISAANYVLVITLIQLITVFLMMFFSVGLFLAMMFNLLNPMGLSLLCHHRFFLFHIF